MTRTADALLAMLHSGIQSDLRSVFCRTSTTAAATDGALTVDKLNAANGASCAGCCLRRSSRSSFQPARSRPRTSACSPRA
jgi:hypothetical protein